MAKILNFCKDFVVIFLCALLLSLLIKTFLIDNRLIPTSSMVPTVPVDGRILVNRLVYDFSEPQFQDIVVFEPTESTKVEVGRNDDMLKRVIGLPGDIVQVADSQLYVNGQAVAEPYLAETMTYSFGPVEVPEGQVLLLGDNRNVSFDAHMWSNPFVPLENIKGKAFFIYWPAKNFGFLH